MLDLSILLPFSSDYAVYIPGFLFYHGVLGFEMMELVIIYTEIRTQSGKMYNSLPFCAGK